MDIKKLNTQHFWTIVSIIRKGGKDAILKLQQLDENADDLARGLLIFDIAMEHAEKDLQKLFADLAGVSIEEYHEMPFDTTLTIVEAIAEKENLTDFFKRAANFSKKFLPNKQTA